MIMAVNDSGLAFTGIGDHLIDHADLYCNRKIDCYRLTEKDGRLSYSMLHSQFFPIIRTTSSEDRSLALQEYFNWLTSLNIQKNDYFGIKVEGQTGYDFVHLILDEKD